VSQKSKHFTHLYHSLPFIEPIFKIISLAHSTVNVKKLIVSFHHNLTTWDLAIQYSHRSKNFLGGVGHGPGTNGFNFGDDPDHRPDPGVRSPKSAFTGLSTKLPTDFDEILWRARDQLITCC